MAEKVYKNRVKEMYEKDYFCNLISEKIIQTLRRMYKKDYFCTLQVEESNLNGDEEF